MKNRILKTKSSTIIFHFNIQEGDKGLNQILRKINFFLDRDYNIILLYPLPQFEVNVSNKISEQIISKNYDYKKNYINRSKHSHNSFIKSILLLTVLILIYLSQINVTQLYFNINKYTLIVPPLIIYTYNLYNLNS